MRALISKKSIIIVAIAVLLAITTLVSVNVFESDGPATGLANTLASPLRNVTTVVVRAFENIYGSIYRYEDLIQRYESLYYELNIMRQQYFDAIVLAQQNDQLREALNLQARHPGHVHEDANIIDRGSSNFTSTFMINRGYENTQIPIEVGNSIVTTYGMLVGRVTSVGPRTATAISVLDTTFSAGVLVGSGGVEATAIGSFEHRHDGLLLIDHIAEGGTVLPGDTVVTSGIGGVFPAGIVIGEVVHVFNHPTGLGQYATVRPLLPIDTVSFVLVIVDFDV